MPLSSKSRSMLVEGAARLGATLHLDQVRQFEVYLDLLQTWGKKINLTSRLSEEEIVRYHFLDSLAGLQILEGIPPGRLADVGAGAGFPGIPLKMVLSGSRLWLIDSSHKKMSFCTEVVRRTGLTGVKFIEQRVERAAGDERLSGRFDWIVTRAFRSAAETLKLVFPLLGPEGSLLLYKGSPAEEELTALEGEASRCGLVVQARRVVIPFLDAARTLITVGPTGSSGG